MKAGFGPSPLPVLGALSRTAALAQTERARAAFPKGLGALADAERAVLRGLSKSDRAVLVDLLRLRRLNQH